MKAFSFFRCLAAALLAISVPHPASADWLQYRGPAQNGTSPEKGFNTPKLLWKAAVGKGTSSMTTMEDKVFTMGNDGANDSVFCLDAATGKEIWRQQFPTRLDPNMFEGGPRSTPALDGSRVYVVSHEGELRCLDGATGKLLWQKNYVREFGGKRPQWGFAGSPLLVGTMAICDVGGADASTIAFDKLTGKVLWKTGSDAPGYATPVVASLGGISTVVVFKGDALVGYELKGGKELWRYPWKTSYEVNAATPVLVAPDKILVSSGYDTGCALLQISGGQVKELWRNKNLRSQINSPVVSGGHVFGIDGNAGGGNLVCLDLSTGERKWIEKSVKGGSLILADGRLIILSEKGELVIAEATGTGFRAFSRSPQLSHRCWVQPTLDNGRLFLRNNEGELLCLGVGAK